MGLLPVEFYQSDAVVTLAQQLLGKVLVTDFPAGRTAVMITEVEAYEGPIDKASHAFGNRKTKRTATMYQSGGCAYIYLCYGIHHLFNIVTAPVGIPHAILLRGGEPLEGIDIMMQRRKMDRLAYRLTAGPGTVAQALGLTRDLNGQSLQGPNIWLEDRGIQINPEQIKSGPRIGVDYAGDHALWPYRFWLQNNPWVSRPR